MNSRIFDIVKRLGELRDGMLVAGAVVYLMGYFTWSAYSWRERLGPVAPLDAQYFAAGTPIALAFAVTILAIIGLRHFADTHWRQFFQKQSARRQKLLTSMLGLVLLVLMVLALKSLQWDKKGQALTLLAVGYTFVQLLGARSGKPDFFARFAPPVVFILITGVAVVAFAATIYETIPDSLGGGRPRRVSLDLRVDAVAPSTVCKLLEVSGQTPLTGVVHTREVDLMSSQDDYYLVLVRATEDAGVGERIQLRRTAVEAITWR